ncbi:acyl-CoA dehydrogenase family protein [Candidatus Binatia bacterium]|nr:acyl-CoA dehydrogenase family protein [Candidatus Binatia bacterium]
MSVGTVAAEPLEEIVARFVQDEVAPQADAHDRSATLNRALLARAGALGLLGITLPVADGGRGGDMLDAATAHRRLAWADPGFAIAFLAQTILFTHNFAALADEGQRRRVLPRVLAAEWIGGMAMTEPSGGTDVLAMRSRAERVPGGYVVQGAKTLITNAPDAQCFLVYAKLDGDVTSFLVERDRAGVSVGPPIDKMGMRAAPMAELVLDACFVPRQNLLGRERAGIVQMMRNLEIERVCLAAMAVGVAERCVHEMIDDASSLDAAGRPRAEDGHVQRHLAEGHAHTAAARSLLDDVAGRRNPALASRVGADSVKLFAARTAKDVADRAVQVRGMAGVCRERGLERLLRDAKLLEIGGGTLEAHQRNVALDLVRAARIAAHRSGGRDAGER